MKLKSALAVLLAGSLLVTGLAGTTAGQMEKSKLDSQQMQPQQLNPGQVHSQLQSMSCSELDSTYERGVERIQNSDMPPERKQRLIQRSSALYELYQFRKGC